ncbi:MAG: sulfurtransferase [Gammaproteobacteria bacterium]|nr:sulfurtransferase [Gammaproteobacteria bacterium]
MDSLVSTEWLSQHLDDPDLIILDCSVYQEADEGGGFHNVSGRVKYEEGHIPNAGFADLKGELSDLNAPIEFAVPTPEQFCMAMGKLGIGDNSRVVLYDAMYSAWAARVWWMLRWVGFDNAALLDGGLQAWIHEGLPLESGLVEREPHQLSCHPRPELITNAEEVLSAIKDEAVQLIDTLPEELYRGEQAIYARPGHIPSAINLPGLNFLTADGHLKTPDELDQAMPGGDRDARNITYCGGGILASLNAFAMTRQGFTDVAVYTASLQEWAADPDKPMVVGEAP